MTCSHVILCLWNSPAPLAGNTGLPAPLAGNTGLHLSRSLSTKQFSQLHNLWTDAGTCVHCTNTCPRYQPLYQRHGQAYHKTSSTKQLLVNEESGYMQAWGKRTSVETSAKLKPALFRANTLHNRLFSEPPTVYRGKHVVSRHFHHSYYKANKVSKSEGTRKVKYAYHFWKCADAVGRKL